MANDAIRLQVYLARAGIASRRGSEELIIGGRVSVNGETAAIGASVVEDRDVVEVDGRIVRPRPTQWVALHKPRGYVSTRDDPEGRKTIYDLLPGELHHLFHVGRLDRESAGLLLLTNDGHYANQLLHPRYETTKEYVVDVAREPSDDELERMVTGVPLDDGLAQALTVELLGRTKKGSFRLRLVMKEGRNREIRRLLETLGHRVTRLFRRRFGPIEIGELAPGRWRYLTPTEITRLTGHAPPTPAPSRRRKRS